MTTNATAAMTTNVAMTTATTATTTATSANALIQKWKKLPFPNRLWNTANSSLFPAVTFSADGNMLCFEL